MLFPVSKFLSSVCIAPFKTTVLNRIHEIFIGLKKKEKIQQAEFVDLLHVLDKYLQNVYGYKHPKSKVSNNVYFRRNLVIK